MLTMSKQRQLIENIEYIVGEYYNGMMDDPDCYPTMTKDQCIQYIKDEIFDMKVMGCRCVYQQGICDDLKFLGNEFIDSKIIELSEDILQ